VGVRLTLDVIMDTKALKKFEEGVALVFVLLGFVFACWVLVTATTRTVSYHEMLDRQQAREAQWHEEWKRDKGCVHTGYYSVGRSHHSYRTYSCNGRVLVERGNRMYDKEKEEYVKW
jgi:hypothetical protein